MKISKSVIGLLSIMLLAACSSPTFGNFSLIGGAGDSEQSTIGGNDRMVYMASGTVNEVCDAQATLITGAGWTITEEPRTEDTYKTSSYTDGTANLTLMCSEQEENAGIKVTLTMQGGK